MTHAILSKALASYASQRLEFSEDLFQPNYVRVGKFDIRYLRQEKAGAPTLVLLNGLPQSIRMWEHAWSGLSRHFDLLAFDIPGFGLSKAQESDMSPRKLSRVIIQVLDHFEIDKAHLIGPDVGVPITLATAIEYPDRLESINIFDGPGTYPPELSPILNAVIKSRFVRWLAKGLNKKAVMKTNFLTAVKEGYHQYRPGKRAVEEYYQITHDDQSHRSAIAFFGTYVEELSWIHEHLKEIHTPTLITWGKLDPFVKVSNADQLSRLIPSTKVEVFDNASHFSSEDAGEDYLNAITNWCQGGYKNLHTKQHGDTVLVPNSQNVGSTLQSQPD